MLDEAASEVLVLSQETLMSGRSECQAWPTAAVHAQTAGGKSD